VISARTTDRLLGLLKYAMYLAQVAISTVTLGYLTGATRAETAILCIGFSILWKLP